MERLIKYLTDLIAEIPLETFSDDYMKLMGFIFIGSIIGVSAWYGWGMVATIRFKKKLKTLNKNDDTYQHYIQGTAQRFNEMNEWVTNEKLLHGSLKKAWKNYFHRFHELARSGEGFVPDVYDFFVEEELVQKFGFRKLVEIIPSVFISFGILGTFLGLVAGIHGLTIQTDTGEIRHGIEGLLDGMSVAFYSSIFGIGLSMVWNLLDKAVFYPQLYRSFQTLRNEMDMIFPTQDEGSFLQSMVSNQKQHMEDFQDFMTQQLIPQMVSGLSENLLPHFEQTNKMIEQALEKSGQTQVEGVQEMVDHFVNSLNELTGDHMKELGSALHTMIEWQERVYEEMSHLVESMQESAREQSLMVEKTTELTAQMHDYTERISEYHSTFQTTVSELNETTERNKELQNSITALLDQMVDERHSFNEVFEIQMTTLENSVESFINHTGLQNQLQEKFDLTMLKMEGHVKEISEAHEYSRKLSEILTQQGELSVQSNDQLQNLLDRFSILGETYSALQEHVSATYDEIVQERENIKNASADMHQLLVSQIREMDARNHSLREMWLSTQENLAQTNDQLSSSMKQFTEHMHQGLERTFAQFDDELRKSIQHLSKGVDGIDQGIQGIEAGISDLPEEINKFAYFVKQLNAESKHVVEES